jgi:hypothetical protein
VCLHAQLIAKPLRVKLREKLLAKEKLPNIPVPPDQDAPKPVQEPPDRPQSEPDAPVREPGPEPPQHLYPTIN